MRIYANTFCILILTYLFTFMFTLCVPPPLCALRVVCFYCLFVLGTFMRHARPCTRQHTHTYTLKYAKHFTPHTPQISHLHTQPPTTITNTTTIKPEQQSELLVGRQRRQDHGTMRMERLVR